MNFLGDDFPERLEYLLQAGYPHVDSHRTLYELEDDHPERELQAMMDSAADGLSIHPLLVAHAWYLTLYGDERLAAARSAYDKKTRWDLADRFILRRLSLAVLRGRPGGAGKVYRLSHVDDFILGVLITTEELAAHVAKLHGQPFH